MVYIEKRKIGTNTYLYLCKKERINGKVTRTLNIYLGKEENLKERLSHIQRVPLEITNLKTSSFGYVAALWRVSEMLNLSTIINNNTLKRNQGLSVGDYITLAVINRIDEPCSKNAIANWFDKTWLYNKYNIQSKILSGQAYWNHLGYLDENAIASIEIALTQQVFQLLDVDLDCLLFDPTNFHTFIKTPRAGKLPQRGHAKSERNDLKIVALSLLVTRDRGIPLMHKTYAGNTHDSTHFKSMIPEFIARFKELNRECEDITIVFDKGNNSIQNIGDLKEKNLNFIASLRPSSFKHLLDYPETHFDKLQLKNEKMILACEVEDKVFGLTHQRVIITKDKESEKRSHINLLERLDFITAELLELRAKLNWHVWKQRVRVEKRITNILDRKAGKCLAVKVEGVDGALSMKIELVGDVFAKMIRGYGRSFLTTSRRDWSMKEVVLAYHDQYEVEHDFREMKCVESIRTNPMRHWTDQKIMAHLFICVLALVMKVFLREYLRKNQVHMSHIEIKNCFQKMVLVQYDLPNKEHNLQISSLKSVTKKIRNILSLDNLI